MQLTGFGCAQFRLAVYIGNRPNTADYLDMVDFRPLHTGDIAAINQACGNGWRKVFNVYAKLLHQLGEPYLTSTLKPTTWQDYRDNSLLHNGSSTALLFSAPSFTANSKAIHIIMGKTYASQVLTDANRLAQLIWLDADFALLPNERLIVCPYFDYRQLSNQKIDRLVEIINTLENKAS